MAKTLIIGGSGAYTLNKEKFGKLLSKKVYETPFGRSNPIYEFSSPSGIRFSFLSRHGENYYATTASFVNYRANIWAAKESGAERIMAWTGPGSLSEGFKPGDYVIIDDLIDFTKKRSYTFFEGKGLGFIRQNPVFCPQLSNALAKTLTDLNLTFHRGGTYVCTEGPRLETPAEIRMFRKLGGDLVGMTIIPEVFLAKELEMCYGVLCYVTNYAEGTRNRSFKPGILFEGMLSDSEKKKVDEAVNNFPKISIKLVENLSKLKRTCPCKNTMKRYKSKGLIKNDWHTWIR